MDLFQFFTYIYDIVKETELSDLQIYLDNFTIFKSDMYCTCYCATHSKMTFGQKITFQINLENRIIAMQLYILINSALFDTDISSFVR